MTSETGEQSLTSKILKVLRITSEPLSAHAISEIYGFSYSQVKRILKELEEDGLLNSLKTNRGKFFFIPDRYLKRSKNLIDTEEKIPTVWYEDFSIKELENRIELLAKHIKKIQKEYQKKEILAIEYFQKIQEKNEEMAIINQILVDRKEKQSLECLYCNRTIEKEDTSCLHCKMEVPVCSVCKRFIYSEQSVVKCSHCDHLAHESHIIEWIKSFGFCPKCKKPLVESDLIKFQG
ncbi:MAG: hypothetical protein EAX90_08155 [Candidatus Heimdallarchaeota archaeon]|nr:hypothetical protein [Candidatus Heimdallarchaeota archaeon]